MDVTWMKSAWVSQLADFERTKLFIEHKQLEEAGVGSTAGGDGDTKGGPTKGGPKKGQANVCVSL